MSLDIVCAKCFRDITPYKTFLVTYDSIFSQNISAPFQVEELKAACLEKKREAYDHGNFLYIFCTVLYIHKLHLSITDQVHVFFYPCQPLSATVSSNVSLCLKTKWTAELPTSSVFRLPSDKTCFHVLDNVHMQHMYWATLLEIAELETSFTT